MTAAASVHSTMRDWQHETTPYDNDGNLHEGYMHLTRRMESEEFGFDVDTTILDFFVHKALKAVFEWRSCDDRFHSDLPDALINMTAGTSPWKYNSLTH